MSTTKIPSGHQSIMPYLILKNAGAFSEFMQRVFGAKETFSRKREDDGIMHAELTLNGNTIMFAESTDQWKPQNAGLFIYVDEADTVYAKALNEGAESVMEMTDQNYGRSGGIKDPFGNVWWITSVR